MTQADDIRHAHDALHADHEALHAVTERLLRAPDHGALATVLEQLHAALRDHFDREELPGGLYEQMGATSGDALYLVQTLSDEHYHLLLAVRGLAQRSRVGNGDGEGMHGLMRQVRGILSLLRSHEDREAALVEMTAPKEA